MNKIFVIGFISLLLVPGLSCFSQISPGPLAAVHSQLEGISNCTKCHSLGNQVTNAKCLECHTEIKTRVEQKKGYHASAEIRGKNCISCHNDHHGVNFQIIRFDKNKFNHDLTGFKLTGAHAKKDCKDCHKKENISEAKVKSKKLTYLGVNPNCLTCHTDYHQKTITAACTNCHSNDAFKPAVKFNHANTKYPLAGMHQNVPCVKCHPVTIKNEKKFQEFAGIRFQSCSNCHNDPHQNKFGPNCTECHSNESFHTVKGIANFDHSRTNFKLENKHLNVPCQKCHKTSVTVPVKHDRCLDCHKDYHNNQFVKQGIVQDCSECHNTKGFNFFSFTLEQHNSGNFKLEGAHVATPCNACHKKQEKWSFRSVGLRCVDCHKDIHEPYIGKEFYPNANCEICHNTNKWGNVTWDHSKTEFPLTGVHTKRSCRDCHFKKGADSIMYQQFSSLTFSCIQCHTDIHYQQFESEGVTDCLRCHTTDLWKIPDFDHNKTAYKLDGKHQKVACVKCHKPVTVGQNTFVLYKIKDSRCEACH
ncbi:MAG: cytochrome C [bacterium]